MITCDEAVRQLWEYVESELEALERQRVEEHLTLCRRCCGEMEFAEELRQFMASQFTVELPPGTAARFDQLLEDLETEGASWPMT